MASRSARTPLSDSLATITCSRTLASVALGPTEAILRALSFGKRGSTKVRKFGVMRILSLLMIRTFRLFGPSQLDLRSTPVARTVQTLSEGSTGILSPPSFETRMGMWRLSRAGWMILILRLMTRKRKEWRWKRAEVLPPFLSSSRAKQTPRTSTEGPIAHCARAGVEGTS